MINNVNELYKKYSKCIGEKKVIIVLLKYSAIEEFINRNFWFLNYRNYDKLIFFVTGNKSLESCNRGIKYFVIDLSNSFYEFPYKFDYNKYTPNYMKGGKWNYQHMCRFFFKSVFLHPALCDAEMFMRLDSDSFINTSQNLFKYMNKSIVYMHNRILNDGSYVTKGIKEFTYSFICALKVRIKDNYNFNKAFINNPLLYYNNFEICRMKFFRTKEMFLFMFLIDLSYGQFLYRWGDAPLRYISLSLYAEQKSKISIPKNVIYCHNLCNK